MTSSYTFYVPIKGIQRCFYLISEDKLSEYHLGIVNDIFSQFGVLPVNTSRTPTQNEIEVGPLFTMETPDSSILKAILADYGMNVIRCEGSYIYPTDTTVWSLHDSMTHQIYDSEFDPVSSFCTIRNTDPAEYICDSFEEFADEGEVLLRGHGMLQEDINKYLPFFLKQERIPTFTKFGKLLTPIMNTVAMVFLGLRLVDFSEVNTTKKQNPTRRLL